MTDADTLQECIYKCICIYIYTQIYTCKRDHMYIHIVSYIYLTPNCDIPHLSVHRGDLPRLPDKLATCCALNSARFRPQNVGKSCRNWDVLGWKLGIQNVLVTVMDPNYETHQHHGSLRKLQDITNSFRTIEWGR